jgi:hypothetical protein
LLQCGLHNKLLYVIEDILSRTLVGRMDAISVYIAWFLLAFFFVRLAFEQFFGTSQTQLYSLSIFMLFISFAVIHVILAFFNRCPHCSKMLTAQGFKSPHPNSSGDWSKVVLNWFSGSVVCIHCGRVVNTNDL